MPFVELRPRGLGDVDRDDVEEAVERAMAGRGTVTGAGGGSGPTVSGHLDLELVDGTAAAALADVARALVRLGLGDQGVAARGERRRPPRRRGADG